MNIEQRFAHLERSNRRLRTGLLSLTIAITTVLIVGQAKPEKVPDVIQAKEFQVVNDTGMKLVRMGAPNGYGAITTFNGKGQELVRLASTVNGEGSVHTYNDKGQQLEIVTALKDGGGGVITFIGDGRVTGGIGAN